MLTRWVVIGCLLPGTGIAGGQVWQGGPEGPTGGASFFSDPAAFDQALQAANKTSKAVWNFSPTNFVPGSIIHVEDPLDILSHPVLAPDIWDNPDGTTSWPPELDNVRFIGGDGGLHVPPTEPGPGLYFATTGFNGIDNNVLGVDLFSQFGGTFNILSGPPAGDDHTAMALEILSLPGFNFPSPLYHVTVYDDSDQQIGKFIQAPIKSEKLFVGIIVGAKQTIGRVEIFDESGGSPGISSIEVYRSLGTPPGCPWDCGIPADGDVGIVDFLAVLAEWDMVGTPCDFDGGGVGITDFLKLLANWGPCPGELVTFYTGQIAFLSSVLQAGKTLQFEWSFDPHSQTKATEVAVPDPLDINTHSGNPDDPWTADGPLDQWPPEVDNVQFTTNLNPQGALVTGNDLAFATAGASPDISTNVLRENTPGGSLDILSGPPAGDNHTAMAFRITGITGSAPGTVPTQFRVTVYDKQDDQIGEQTLNGLNGDVIFLGFITIDPSVTIGRVDIWDINGSFEGITTIWAYNQ